MALTQTAAFNHRNSEFREHCACVGDGRILRVRNRRNGEARAAVRITPPFWPRGLGRDKETGGSHAANGDQQRGWIYQGIAMLKLHFFKIEGATAP